MGGEFVVVGAREFVDESFETGGAFKVYELAALEAYKVVVMCFEGLSELVTLFEANLNNVDDTEFCKELERPVNARTLCKLARFENLL